VAADAAVCCSGDAKVLQHLKTSGAVDIAATAMLGFHNMSVLWIEMSFAMWIFVREPYCRGWN